MSASPQSRFAQVLGMEMHYNEWGRLNETESRDGPSHAGAPVVFAWHGLARTGRDMDELAAHLSPGFRVICPDNIGRGLSQWSADPAQEYQLSFYAKAAFALMDALHIERAHWVGTSMGGAIGMVCAASLQNPAQRRRIQSLVLNDSAPELAQTAVARIRAYAGNPPAFDTLAQLQTFFRQVYAPYGWMSDAQWQRLTLSSARRLPNGQVTPHYDPAMVRQFIDHPNDYLLWSHYDAIECPVLCLRGAQSDLVLPDVVANMHLRGPGLRAQFHAIEVPGCGHAPPLNVPEQLAWVSDFLHAAQGKTV